MVQLPTACAALEKLMLPAPALAVTVPTQCLTTCGGVATTRVSGRVSVKLALIVTTFGLLIANVIVLGAPIATVVGLKLLVMDGGARMTMPPVAVPPLDGASPALLAV